MLRSFIRGLNCLSRLGLLSWLWGLFSGLGGLLDWLLLGWFLWLLSEDNGGLVVVLSYFRSAGTFGLLSGCVIAPAQREVALPTGSMMHFHRGLVGLANVAFSSFHLNNI